MIKTFPVTVSYHARERCRERFFDGVDIPNEHVDAYILAGNVKTAVALGVRRVTGADGMIVIADCGHVVTVLPEGYDSTPDKIRKAKGKDVSRDHEFRPAKMRARSKAIRRRMANG